MSKKTALFLMLLALVALAALAACAPAPAAPQVVQQTVVIEKPVQQTVVVEKPVPQTVVVPQTVAPTKKTVVTIAYNGYFNKTFGPADPPIKAIQDAVAGKYTGRLSAPWCNTGATSKSGPNMNASSVR